MKKKGNFPVLTHKKTKRKFIEDIINVCIKYKLDAPNLNSAVNYITREYRKSADKINRIVNYHK